MSEQVPPAAPPAPPSPDAPDPPFEFTPDRKFALYMHQRESHSKGARNAYQRFDQTIVGLSAGSIVLSITFLKDFGRSPESMPWLFVSWGCFLFASLCAFISLLTSAEADREQMKQLDCQVETGTCDTKKADRLGFVTVILNYSALTLCIVGVILIITFATKNLLQGGEKWQEKKEAPLSQPAVTNVTVYQEAASGRTSTAPAATNPQKTEPSTGPARPESSRKGPTPATPSPRP